MQNKKFLPLIIGIVLAALATYLVMSYLRDQSDILKEEAWRNLRSMQENQTAVFVAASNIPAGTIITPSLINQKILFKEEANPNAIRYFSQLDGTKAVVPIRQGEQITPDMVRGARAVPTTLSMLVPEGKRAVTIKVDNISSLMGMITPGDHVDVIGIVPIASQGATQMMHLPLFQDVLVIAVGGQTQEPTKEKEGGIKGWFSGSEKKMPEEGPAEEPLITLALVPEEAAIISFVQENGKVRLLLRSQLDAGRERLPTVNWDSFYQFIVSRGIVPPPRERAPEDTIEIYRGTSKEYIPISR